MSNLQNERFKRFEVFESQIRGTRLLDSQGKEIGTEAKELVVQLLTEIVVVWDQLIREAKGSLGIPEGEWKRWLNAISSTPVPDILACFKQALGIFDQYLSEGTILQSTWSRFKHDLREDGVHCIGVLGLVRPIVEACFAGNGDTREIRQVRQALGLLSKTALPLNEEELASEALEKFQRTDALLSHRQPTRRIRRFFDRVFGGLRLPHPRDFHHGNGQVAELSLLHMKPSIGLKYRLMVFDRQTVAILLALGYDPDWIRTLRTQDATVQGEVATVPKNATARRTIVMQPICKQWLQQGISEVVWDKIRSDPYLSRRMEQDNKHRRNQALAKRGSIRAEYATIDLSAASDSVSFAFVRSALSNNATWQMMLEAAQTHSVRLPDGTVLTRYESLGACCALYSYQKAGDMGSADTFPLECIVFSSIVEEAIELQGGNPRTSRYVVHGDDIVVETEYAQAVMDRLTYYGFTVNHEKSFYKRQILWNFRESCGVFYLDGQPIDILRYPRQVSPRDLKNFRTSWPAFTVSLVNNAYYYGLYDLRTWLIRRWLNKLPTSRRVAFTTEWDDDSKVFTPQPPTNYQLRRPPACAKWRQGWEHRYVFGIVKSLHSKQDALDLYGAERLYEWLRKWSGKDERLPRGNDTGSKDTSFLDEVFPEPRLVQRSETTGVRWVPVKVWKPLRTYRHRLPRKGAIGGRIK